MASAMDPSVESQITEWRRYLLRRRTIHDVDVEELEDHLRSQMSELEQAGLSDDESFLVAIKRLGGVSELSREFARERSSRLWKHLVLGGESAGENRGALYRQFAVMAGFALLAALTFKLPALFGIDPFATSAQDSPSSGGDASFYLRNTPLILLSVLTAYFAWRRSIPMRGLAVLSAPFLAAAILMNVFPFQAGGDTELLAGLHLGLGLWLVAGVAYLAGSWQSGAPRMDFVRFTGEAVIYYTLIALGGMVLVALTIGVFEAIGVDIIPLLGPWVVPMGAAGAVIVVAWLVEAKQSVIENMAPVLTAVFTPFFAVMLVSAIGGMLVTGNLIDPGRDTLILLDVLLVVVLGLLLYSFSARDTSAKPGVMDVLHLVLVVSALIVDTVALAAILGRINEFGFTPNRTAGLGLNLVLFVNLGWSAWLIAGFLRGTRSFAGNQRWQTSYIPVYGLWALVVVVAFPPLFGFR